jgi:cysteine desulfurase
MLKYFDWAASSPPSPESITAPFGNPSSQHSEGRAAKQALDEARAACAAVLGVPAQTLYFTSGGTESNAIAIFSCLMRKGQGAVLASDAEHSSVREAMETLDKMGKMTGAIEVDSLGRVTADTLEKALGRNSNTRFVSCMAVNNETGSITDIASLRDVLKKQMGAPIHLHCDMVQAIGKTETDLAGMEIDSASFSAHKIGGPRGIGLLYLRRPVEVFYSGGGQESGIRGGTENTYGAMAMARCMTQYAAKEAVQRQYGSAKKRWAKLIDALSKMQRAAIIPSSRAADDERFSPYILQAAFKDIPGEVMARALDDLGFAVSTGSACSSASPERPVLAAMGIDERLRIEGIRISQGYTTTEEEIDLLLEAIGEVLKFL